MNQSTYNSLKSFIWGIANDCLVDVYDVGDYRKMQVNLPKGGANAPPLECTPWQKCTP
jgi:hypothetical protein